MNATPVALVTITLLLGSCQVTGVDSSASTAQAMKSLTTGLEEAPAKINAVSASLKSVVSEGGDMKAEFATFSKDVESLLSHRDHIRTLSDKVDQNETAFTRGWEARTNSIRDESLRQRSNERRDEVVKKFSEIKTMTDEGKKEFEPWLQKVLDVRQYLESDLNPDGVASVKDKASEISEGAESVNEKITQIVDELKKTGDAIAAAKPPEPTEAPKK